MFSVVGVCLTFFDKLDGKLVQFIKIIGGMSKDIAVDVKQGKILKNSFLEFGL